MFSPPASPAAWLARRWVPAMLLCTLTGIFFGWIRVHGSAWIGVAGMIAGGAAGYGAGRLGDGDGATFWGFGQRFALALGGSAVYLAAQLLTAGALHGSPADTPFTWIGEMAQGGLRERFFSLGQTGGMVLHLYRGSLSGGWWGGFNFLDALLFAFLFLVSCGIGLSRKESLPPPSPSRCAIWASLALTAALVAGVAGAWHLAEGPYPSRFSPEERRELERLAGTFRLTERDGTALPRGRQELLRIRAAGFDTLEGRLEGATFTVTRRRTHFSGLLFRRDPATPLPLRLVFSPDGTGLYLKIVTFTLQGRRNVVFRGVREGLLQDSSPAGTLWVRRQDAAGCRK